MKFKFKLKVKVNGYWYNHTLTNNEEVAWSALERVENKFPCELWEDDTMIWAVL